MPDAAASPVWAVRRAWPDELRRMAKHLRDPVYVPHPGPTTSFVVAAEKPERLVGAGRCIEPARVDESPALTNPSARLTFSFKAAWRTHPAAEALVREMVADARLRGLQRLSVQLHPDDPLAPLVRAQGFGVQSEHEEWRLHVPTALERRVPTIERTLARRPVTVTPLAEVHLPAVRTLCARLGLLTPERVHLGGLEKGGLDPRFSLVAGPTPDDTRAVALARPLGPTLYLEVLGVDPAYAQAREMVGALVVGVFRRAHDEGFEHIRCVVTPARGAAVLALLRRAGGECVNRYVVYASGPGASS